MNPTTPVTLPEVYTLEVIDADPATRAKNLARHQRTVRNSRYLSDHAAEMAQHRGRYVAVVDEQLFVADTYQEALDWIRATDPDGCGLVEYVSPKTGPRVYGPLRRVADVP